METIIKVLSREKGYNQILHIKEMTLFSLVRKKLKDFSLGKENS